MAGFQLLKNIIGDSLVGSDTVFNGQTVYYFEFNFSGLYLVLKQIFENPCGLLGDHGADSVAAAYADYYLVKRLEIQKIALRLYFVGALALRSDKGFKFFNSILYLCVSHCFYLSYLCDSLV